MAKVEKIKFSKNPINPVSNKDIQGIKKIAKGPVQMSKCGGTASVKNTRGKVDSNN